MNKQYAPIFCAMPPAAMKDGRLTVRHYRTLGIIAGYDRFSERNGGEGCFVSREKLASELGVAQSTLSDAINDLAQWKYLKIGRHSRFRNRQTYTVCYSAGSKDGCE